MSPYGNGRKKKELNLGDAGSAEVLSISDIQVDAAYQRELRREFVEKVANEWDIVKAGAITISRRKNGTLWCVDGQHRMAAADLAGEVEVFAHVLADMTREEEADLRLALNDRKADTIYEKFRARLVKGDDTAHRIVEIAHQAGTTINLTPNRHSGINAINAAETLYNVGEDGSGVWLGRVLKFINEAFSERNRDGEIVLGSGINGQTASAAMLKSVYWFIDRHMSNGVRWSEIVDRVRKFGVDDIDRKARSYKASMGGALWLNYYRAIVEVYNFRRSDDKKLEWQTKGSITFDSSGSGGSKW